MEDIISSARRLLPLILVFLSGLGFSLQQLIVKLLKLSGFNGSFQCVMTRGWIQLIIACFYIYFDEDRKAGKNPPLFGDSPRVSFILFLRSFVGYGGICFSFLAIERLPLGDASVLVMLSPLFASIGGYFILSEPWRWPEFVGTIMSLTGATLVAKPPFLFHYFSGTPSSNPESSNIVGVVYALLASLSAGGAFILIRMLGTSAKMPWSYVCLSQAIGQIVLAIPSQYAFHEFMTFNVTLYQTILIFLGGFIGAWSQIAMTIGMQREKSATASAMRMSDVVFGFIWQILFTPDRYSWLSIIGAFLVMTSIIVIIVFKEGPSSPPSSDHGNVQTTKDSMAAVEMVDKSTFRHLDSDVSRKYFSSNRWIRQLQDLYIGFDRNDDSYRDRSYNSSSNDGHNNIFTRSVNRGEYSRLDMEDMEDMEDELDGIMDSEETNNPMFATSNKSNKRNNISQDINAAFNEATHDSHSMLDKWKHYIRDHIVQRK